MFEWSARVPFSPHDAPIKVLEGMPDPDFRPFAWVQGLFDERARLIKIDPNDVTAIVIKLVLNSLYGKLAQYVGMAGTAAELRIAVDGRRHHRRDAAHAHVRRPHCARHNRLLRD